MKNCTITLDVTGFGYTYLLQLDSMLGDFLEDGNNAAAADTLHDWMTENARNFTEDARANGDTLAADIFSDMAAEDDEREEYTLPADDAKIEEVEQAITRTGLDVTVTAKTNAGGYATQAILSGDADDIQTILEEIAAPDTDEDTRTGAELYLDMATQAYLDAPENSNLEAALQANATDTNNDPDNLFRAGVFAGLAEAAAWGIYATSKVDDINAIKAAVYKAYGVAW